MALMGSTVLMVADGIDGAPGDVGGPQGPRGVQGPQGAPGPTGAQGPLGPVGGEGPRGNVGPQGIVGPQGGEGQRGPEGVQGQIGRTGRVAGWVRITDSHSGVGGGARTLDLICPEGTKVLSGGYSITSESFQYLPEQIIPVENLPLVGGHGWRVSTSRPPVTYAYTVNGFAICAEVE